MVDAVRVMRRWIVGGSGGASRQHGQGENGQKEETDSVGGELHRDRLGGIFVGG